MKIDIEDIAEEKGKHIANLIVEKYSEDLTTKHETFFASFLDGLLDGDLSRSKVEREIYEGGSRLAPPHLVPAPVIAESHVSFGDWPGNHGLLYEAAENQTTAV
jgi:hypothetical protein